MCRPVPGYGSRPDFPANRTGATTARIARTRAPPPAEVAGSSVSWYTITGEGGTGVIVLFLSVSFLPLLRAFLLHVIKRDQVQSGAPPSGPSLP